jgi:hypothetical protein
MRPGDASRFLSKIVAINKTITNMDLEQWGHIVATAPNLILTHPQPRSGIEGYECVYTNASTGLESIVCNNGFVDGSDTIILLPGESVHLWCQKISATAYAWLRQGKDYLPKPVALAAGNYTATWGTATPAPITALIMVYKYKGICWVQGQLSGTDGNAASSLTLALKGCIPQDLDLFAALTAEQIVDGAKTPNFEAYVDCSDNTPGNRGVIAFRNFAALTDTKEWSIKFSGAFPMYGATSYTSTPAWTGGSPTVTSTTAFFIDVDGEVYWWLHCIGTNGANATDVTFTPPLYPEDMGLYTAGRGYQLVNAAYTSPLPYTDCDHATPGSRLIGFKAPVTFTTAVAFAVVAAGHYPLHNNIAVTPVETFTGTMPALWTTNHVMRASKTGRVLNFHYYSTSTDGNGCTDMDIPLPAVPIYASMTALCPGFQLVNTAKSNPRSYVDYSQAVGTTRATIQQGALSAFTDAVTATLITSGELLLDS